MHLPKNGPRVKPGVTNFVLPGLTRNPSFPAPTTNNCLHKLWFLATGSQLNKAENISMTKLPCVYIMTNQPRGTLYIGVTSNLIKRVWQHRTHAVEGFTTTYGLTDLVYYELHEDMYEAIKREKVLKGWNRQWKIELIENANRNWVDLFSEII